MSDTDLVEEVRFPYMRADVVDAIELLSTLPLDEPIAWHDLTEAVHGVVDDTYWDRRSPKESVGVLLRDDEEAEAVQAVVTPLLAILGELGPTAPDDLYFAHPSWDEVRHASSQALRLLKSNDAASAIDDQ
jgi:hypothetical protein